MDELANKIQIVINTIQDIDIKATFDNMNRLMGALQTLTQIRDELGKQEKPVLKVAKIKKEDTENGNADAE